MSNEQVLEQLKELKNHCEDFCDKEDQECVWNKDIEALDKAIEALENIDKALKRLEELKNIAGSNAFELSCFRSEPEIISEMNYGLYSGYKKAIEVIKARGGAK